MVVLPIDPFRVHVYWTIGVPGLEADPAVPPEAAWGADPVLRFYSIPLNSSAIEDCTGSFDVPVQLDAPNWYVQLPKPAGRYVVELGLRRKDAQLTVLARSTPVQPPPASPSKDCTEVLMLVVGDLTLPHLSSENREEQPAEELPVAARAGVEGSGHRPGFDPVSWEEPARPPSPWSWPEILECAKAGRTASTSSDKEAADGKPPLPRQLMEADEGLFRSGFSSISVEAYRSSRQ